MTFIKRISSGWTLLKFVRVGLGALILLSSVQNGQAAGIILGGFFTVFALFTEGVCCAGNCYIPEKPAEQVKSENVEYEELGAK